MIKIMKTYINAELQIVRMNNNDIVTTSLGVNNNNTTPVVGNSPERRKSIWD